jgi:hypothetical protein
MLRHIKPTHSNRNQAASHEYSRILSAAVINTSFRKMLLKDPFKAVSSGYSGEIFNLNRADENRLASIRAESLADFAAQLSQI